MTPPLLQPLGALLRIALSRARSDWAIVLAAALVVTTATTLLAAGAIYAGAISIASLHRVLEDAPIRTSSIQATVRVDPTAADDAEIAVAHELRRALGPTGGEIVRQGRSDTFGLPAGIGSSDGTRTPLAILGFADGIDAHASLLGGAWPGDVAPGDDVPVALAEPVASRLALSVGDVVPLASRLDPSFAIRVRVTAIFRVDDPAAPYWWADPQTIDGLTTSEDYETYGPFMTTRSNLIRLSTVLQVPLIWRATPDIGNLALADVDALATRVAGLKGAIEGRLGNDAGVAVTTGLPDLLATAQRSLLVSRTGVLLLTIQLTILAAYATLLSAGLLIEHRRLDTAMLRARGAGRRGIAALAAIEGIVIVGVAVAVAPWLAAAALRLLGVAGPLADAGLRVDPEVTPEAYLAAAAAGLLCLGALLIPTVFARGTLRATDASLSRAETRDIGRRLGLDVALVAVAALGLFQLREYGAPLTRTVRGAIGLDPLLVAAPAIGLLAGGVVALRLIPLVAALLEGATTRGRGLVASLGARQLSRRPLRYTRSALLLTLAMAMGVFAVAYTATWSASQADQAVFQVGADVRVEPSRRSSSPPDWALARAYAALPGVSAVLPVVRQPVSVGRVTTVDLVGLDASTVGDVLRLRSDLSTTTVEALMAPLAQARPQVEAVALPAGTSAIRVDVEVALSRLSWVYEDGQEPTIPADWKGLGATVFVRDATGVVTAFGGAQTAIVGGPHPVEVSLFEDGASGGAARRPADPLDVVGIQLGLALPQWLSASGTVTISGLEARTGGGWQTLPLTLARGWRASSAYFGNPASPIPGTLSGPVLSVTTGGDAFPEIPGGGYSDLGLLLDFTPSDVGDLRATALPVVVTDALLRATGSAVGDDVAATIGGTTRRLRIAGSMRAFPSTDAATPVVLVDLPTLALASYAGDEGLLRPKEWWLAVDPARRAEVVAALAGGPFASESVETIADRERSLETDPVALGIVGALAIGFVAAALFAVLGFVVSTAVTARERITEFALLRALGLSIDQLSAWLALESIALAVVSLLAGIGLGLLIAWVSLPFVTVTQEAQTPYPPVEIQIPWATIAILAVVGIVALAVTVVLLTRVLRRLGLASALRVGED